MKTKIVIILMLFISNLALGNNTIKTGTWNGNTIRYYDTEVALGLEKGRVEDDIDGYLDSLGVEIAIHFGSMGLGMIVVPAKSDLFAYIDTLKNHPYIRFAEPSFVGSIAATYPNDPHFADSLYQWPLRNTGQSPTNGTSDADIDLPEAWDYETDANSVLVAIIDTGIPMWDNDSLTHADLDDRSKFLIGTSTDYGNDEIADEQGHGSHVAGIIAAESNNSVGLCGVSCQTMSGKLM